MVPEYQLHYCLSIILTENGPHSICRAPATVVLYPDLYKILRYFQAHGRTWVIASACIFFLCSSCDICWNSFQWSRFR